MIHHGNVTKINGAEVEPVDIITFGSPCQDLSVAGKRAGIQDGERSNLFFEAVRIIKEMREATNGEYPKYAVWENVCFAENTLITCENGYKPIENISIGEKVKTLSGKYMPVVKVHKTKRQNVFKLSASGGEDLIVTGNHPFYARQKIYDTGGRKTITDAQWTEVKDLTEKHLIAYRIDEPILPENFISEIDAWLLGRWLADGSVDLTKATPRIFISVGNAKLEDVRNKLRSSPYELSENAPHETATNFTFTSNEFYSLIAECGVGAGQKKVASYIFTLPHRLQKCILDGYMSGDGYMRKRFNGTEITAATASRELAYGIARLVRNCHKTGANISCRPAKNGLIDGRVIKANYPSYNVTASIGGKSSQSVFDGTFVWQPVRSVQPLEEKQDVYNLSVLEDNTYAANDIICHNCGAFSSNKGHDFHAVLEALCSVCDDTVSIPKPYDAKRTKLEWNKAGEIVGDNYSIAWRTLDAQYWRVPQRRKRIYLVADFTGRRAGEILFKQDGLRGDFTQGDEAGKGATADVMGGVDGSSGNGGQLAATLTATYGTKWNGNAGSFNGENFVLQNKGVDGSVGVECLNPWDSQSIRQYSANGAYPALSSNATGGQNRQGVVMQAAGFCQGASPAAQTIGYQEEIAPTVKGAPSGTAQVPAVVLAQVQYGSEIARTLAARYDSSPCADRGQNIAVIAFAQNQRDEVRDLGDKAGALAAEAGVHQQTYVAQPVIALQANGIDRADTAGCNGCGWRENESYTLNTVDRHAVCYDARGNGDGETACTITGDHQNRITDYTAVAVQETKPPRRYIIRRLTPTECARLQGFPDWWSSLAPYDPADAEFWEDVRKTHAEINGKKYKPVKDVKKWYEKLHTDSAEYKAYGNGLALPCAEFVIHGIAEQGAKTLGSLFDGIGGFPLAGVLNGITPLWASEVEPYPIAVTKSRFKEVNDG